MKNSGKILIAALAFCMLGTSAVSAQKAPKPFKGVITYSMTYTGIDAATAAQKPKVMTIAVLGNITKKEISAGPVVFDMITNGDNKTAITLIDMAGQKIYFRMSTAEIEAQIAEEGTPEIKYFEDTKDIAGYTCKKAEYTMKDEDGNLNTTVVWYTDLLGGEIANYAGQFTGLKGMPLEYEIKQGEEITKTLCTEVKKGKVKDTDFLVPADYTELTADEKQQLLDQLKGKE